MRHFAKRASPLAFEDWKRLKNDDWSPSYKTLAGEPRRALLRALLEEQSFLCCYCGRLVDETTCHVEHARPQETHAKLELEYLNLHASCIRVPEAQGATLHCGHAKGNGFCEERFISPMDETCERRFMYDASNGAALRVDPDDVPAAYMLGLLDLNVNVLKAWRKAELDGVFDNEFVMTTTEEELRNIAESFRRADADGRGKSFGHVIARHAEQLIQDMRRPES
ncbi:retron system putative HNH endonuclease [Roseateles sp. 22389]